MRCSHGAVLLILPVLAAAAAAATTAYAYHQMYFRKAGRFWHSVVPSVVLAQIRRVALREMSVQSMRLLRGEGGER